MAVLDRETTPSYSFMVSATETMTQEARAATVPLTITLTDENDVTPYFASQVYTLHVQENQPIGTSFAAITASDDDLGPSGMLSYSLAGAASSAFTVNSAGDISTNQILDRESAAEYIISLLATDLDPLYPRTAAVQIIISVNDTNDNDPFFDPSVYYQSVSEAATPNTLVIQVTLCLNLENTILRKWSYITMYYVLISDPDAYIFRPFFVIFLSFFRHFFRHFFVPFLSFFVRLLLAIW